MTNLREKLPEGLEVEVVSSEHPFLEAGMRGKIHWNHDKSVLPDFHSDEPYVHVGLVPGRDKVKVQESPFEQSEMEPRPNG